MLKQCFQSSPLRQHASGQAVGNVKAAAVGLQDKQTHMHAAYELHQNTVFSS